VTGLEYECQNSHVVKPVVFDAFFIVGSRLWVLWGISLKVYGYPVSSDTATLYFVIGLANVERNKTLTKNHLVLQVERLVN
jgi:hypothetical protein